MSDQIKNLVQVSNGTPTTDSLTVAKEFLKRHDNDTGWKIANLPTEFKGCSWNAGWEFDCPAVVYSPWKMRGYIESGSSGSNGVETIIENIANDIRDGLHLRTNELDEQMHWRGWGKRFDRRRSANHYLVKVEWHESKNGIEVRILSVEHIKHQGRNHGKNH